jgi:pyruvate dehydrogenase E2 component (dihydrolipoamide acetyltransferase)
MAILLRMPEVAANVPSARLIAWTKKENESVAIGDCLAEIETDKATVEISAESAGILGKFLVEAGSDVAVGSPIAVLLSTDEREIDIDALIAASADPPSSDTELATEPAATVARASTPSRVSASPLARRLALARGIDLSRLTGNGPGGRIVKRDVENASSAVAPIPKAPISPAQPRPAPAEPFTEIPHSGMRRTIAKRLSESKQTIPHFYLAIDCNVAALMKLRTEVNDGAQRKISINDFIVRAAAVALREVPTANVGWTESAMHHYEHADIAVAVSTESGLITPVVRAADRKSVSSISAEIADLATRARASQLRPDEYQGGSFTVSNLGMYGVPEFIAIISPPQAAILAVGATQRLPVANEDAVGIASIMRCTLSVDHRAIDGAVAANWAAAFKRIVERPLLMLI